MSDMRRRDRRLGRSRRERSRRCRWSGFLRSASLSDASHLVAGFRQGLAMMLSSKTFRASWSIGLAAALVAAVPPGRMARAENIVGGAFAPHLLDAAASEGAFRHLRALQDIASESGGNRAAGTLGYDRSAEYVAERLKEAGYLVHFEEFEFPFFEERVPPVSGTAKLPEARGRRSRIFSPGKCRGAAPRMKPAKRAFISLLGGAAAAAAVCESPSLTTISQS
jgi:hypothetical protein